MEASRESARQIIEGTAAADVLDDPIWSALTTRQRGLAEGNRMALRYPAAIAPHAAIYDASDASFAALEQLIAPGERVVLVSTAPLVLPNQFAIHLARTSDQMVLSSFNGASDIADHVVLGTDDMPEMLELIAAAKPGPFARRAYETGSYVGIRVENRLVAMAGQRMKPAGFTEISAVCTHPAHRGHGYARAMVDVVTRNVLANGCVPFLHVRPTNTTAIALYERCGFTPRRRMHMTIVGTRA